MHPLSEQKEKTVALHTMGCRANQYDSSIIEKMLADAGWKLVPFESPAEAYILNTCTVTEKADREARSLIRKAKRQNPDATVIVTGCYAQTNPKALAAQDGVSWVLGNNQKERILDYLSEVQPLVPKIIVEDLFREQAIFGDGFAPYSERSRAFLKIQDGCNQMCSYCVIPFARGKNRSLDIPKVLEQLSALGQAGFKEVVLTGIHIGTYGHDLDQKTDLLTLLRRIEDQKPVHRVRLSSIDPEEISPEFVDFLADSKVFCPFLHLPVQSGDDFILKLMRRRYTAQEFSDLVFHLKTKIPNICLGTDVMVGFPYETDERFDRTFKFLEALPLDYLHVFPYAPRPKTRAANFLEQVSAESKKQRVKKLTRLSDQKKQEFYNKAVGSMVELVWEQNRFSDLLGYQKGVSENYIPVYVRGAQNPFGQISNVRLLQFEGGKVFGEIIEGREEVLKRA